MDYLNKLLNETKLSIFMTFVVNNIVLVAAWYSLDKVLGLSYVFIIPILVVIMAALAVILSFGLSNFLLQPLKLLWKTILELSPDNATSDMPPLDDISFGKELASNLVARIYQFVSVSNKINEAKDMQIKDLSHNFIAQNLPLPLIVLDANETIRFVNQSAATYIGFDAGDLIGKNVYMVLDMAFLSEDTFDNWLKKVKVSSATSANAWQRVKLDVRDNHPKLLFDLAAYYNRDNPDQHETLMVLFDHTKEYSQDDQAISFVALSVHELRTPLTLLRGYIEVFQEEFEGKLTPELNSFMEKMQSQSEQLMAFVNNILNVARIDDNQLELKLQESSWKSIIDASLAGLSIRAKVRGITLTATVADNLPPVAVDSLSIQEVINNLVDNAIKYSGNSTEIKIESHLTNEGLVETNIEDFGLGIPTTSVPNLFTKFYRDHHNRSQVGGTGLGLYLSKAIVTAHGGNIWVRSIEGKGSVFSFTIQPFATINEKTDNGENQEIVRGAHGWIKNHSLYRR
jgi:signal transduction histidine kinase